MTAKAMPRAVRPLAVLLAVCIATWIIGYLLHFPNTGIDDANIFLVYARNVSAGDGFVFNAGGERVEGFTSLLWVLIGSIATLLPGGPERWLLAFNVLLVSVTIDACLRSFVFHRSPSDDRVSPPWAATFLVLLLADYRYVAWNTVALMETALWSWLVTMSALLVLKDGPSRRRGAGLAIVIALMTLTRPEALLWAPVVLGLFVIKGASSEGYAVSLRRAAPAVLAYVVTAGALTLFRLAYFGFPLPNTFYAKVSSSLAYSLREGGVYLWSYLMSGPVPFAAAAAVGLSAPHFIRVRFRDVRTLVLGAMACVGLLIPAVTGGDHFEGFRFYQSVYPVLLLALFNCARFVAPQYVAPQVLGRYQRASMLVGGATLAAMFLTVQVVDWMQFERRLAMGMEFAIAQLGRERGESAEQLFSDLQPRPTIGTITVGGFKYAYSGDVIDLMGLNNTRMAHNGGDRIGFRSHAAFEKRVFYEQRPMAVVPLVQFSSLPCVQARSRFVDLVLKGLLDDQAFRTAYVLAEVRRARPDGVVAVAAWYDRAFLSRLGHVSGFDIVVPEGNADIRVTECDVPPVFR